MSQDIVADALNMLRNAKKARKETVKIQKISNMLIEVLKIMKQREAIKQYKVSGKDKSGEVILGDLTNCKAIKPRFTVGKNKIDKYVRRYLPARNLGTVIVSTNQGLMPHEEAIEKQIGGSLIAYFY
ncbi:MAG: 30S ribosomal protein S8 [Candidatus Pacearchaeota archaeon]